MKKTVLMGTACLLAGVASADVAALESAQAGDANIVYQYTFEGAADTNSMEQKVSPFTPVLERYTNDTNAVPQSVTFTNGFDGSTKMAQTTAGPSDGTRHYGSGLRSVENISYPTNGTIEYLVRCADLNDTGHVISGGDASLSNNLGRLIFFRNDSQVQSKAQMMLGDSVLVDLIGGDTGVGYSADDWYYVAQTWSLSGTTMVVNAWVANISAGVPPTQTVDSQNLVFDDSLDTILYLGSRAVAETNGTLAYYSNSDLDALAIYDTVLDAATIASHCYTAYPGPYSVLNVERMESSQAANADIAHQYTFTGTFVASNGSGTWIEDKVGTAHLSQTLYEPTRMATQVAGYDGVSPSADFNAWDSGIKGDGLTTGADNLTFATNGTVEYLVRFDGTGANTTSHIMLSGDGTGSADRFRFLILYGGGVDTVKMTLGENAAEDVIGGTSGVAYNDGHWYYVAQTWEISGASVTFDAWVANLTAGDVTLTKTIDGAFNYFEGDTVAELDLANLVNITKYFADGGMDALAVYDAVLDPATFQSHLDDIITGPIDPATILSISPISSDVLKMVINAPSVGYKYYPKSTGNLVTSPWTGVGHSTDGSAPFIETNLSYVSEYDATGTNKVIYVQATNAASFFGIGNE